MLFRKLEGATKKRLIETFEIAGKARFEEVRGAVARFAQRDVTDEEVMEAVRAVPCHFAGMSSVVAQITAGMNWTCQNNLTGAIYNPNTQQSAMAKGYPFGTAKTNSQSSGGDEVFSFQQGITAAGSVTLNLNSMTNLLAQTGVAIQRIKGMIIRLLSGSDDSSLSPTPTATSTMTVTNNGIALPSQLDFGNGGSGATATITVNFAGGAITAVAAAFGGSGYPVSGDFLATPVQAGGSGCKFLSLTNAAGNVNTTTFIAGKGGSGYVNGTVPMVPVGQYNIATGGCHVYFDPIAAGFLTVGLTTSNILLINMDPSNAVTAEIDFLAASS
jgi:hypothetical protein